MVTEWPWSMRVVLVKRGRLKDEKSFALMFFERGQACLAASMLSMIPQIWETVGLVLSTRLSALHAQYCWRSLCCLSKCLRSRANWARRAGGQKPSFLMINLCLRHWLHFEWWVKKRILRRSSKSCCQTWAKHPKRDEQDKARGSAISFYDWTKITLTLKYAE